MMELQDSKQPQSTHSIIKRQSLAKDERPSFNTDYINEQSKKHLKKTKTKKKSSQSLKNSTQSSQSSPKKGKFALKHLLKKTKVQQISKQFILKCNKTNTKLSPVIFNPFDEVDQEKQKCQMVGFCVSKKFQIFQSFIYILHFIMFLIVYGLTLAFNEVSSLQIMVYFKIFSVCVLIEQIIFGIFFQKFDQDRQLKKITQIFYNYTQRTFFIDILSLLIFIGDLTNQIEGIQYLNAIYFLKIREFFKKISEVEVYFIRSFLNEQYWRVVKVFLTNFLIAHFIAILYILMASQSDNWMNSIGIDVKRCSERYAFAYFWAMSTMLGFGNATPSNSKEAYLIAFIECFSCIFMAYIINYVGIIITKIADKNEEKQKQLRTARRLAQQNNVSEQILQKICSYIRLSKSVQNNFTFESDAKFLTNLPQQINEQFLKESNKNFFSNVNLFNEFTKKTLLNLAHKITMKIAHPNQIIVSKKQNTNFIFLKKGQIGIFSTLIENSQKQISFDKIKVSEKDSIKLLNLHKMMFHENEEKILVKSSQFSILGLLNYDKVIQVISKSNYDYEKFCQIRDKDKSIVDEFQYIKCQFCSTKHNKLKCPRLHYAPYQNLTVFKFLKKFHRQKNQRKIFTRYKKNVKQFLSILKIYSLILKPIEKMILSDRDIISGKTINDLQQLQSVKFYQQSQKSKLSSNDCKILTKTISEMKNIFDNYQKHQTLSQVEQYFGLQTDKLHNYSFYFPHFNAQKLESLSKQSKKREKRKNSSFKSQFDHQKKSRSSNTFSFKQWASNYDKTDEI